MSYKMLTISVKIVLWGDAIMNNAKDKLKEYLDKMKQSSQAGDLPFWNLRENQSLLSYLHGIDIDSVEERLLFRAEYDFERRHCENFHDLIKKAGEQITSEISRQKWDYEDIQIRYAEIYKKILEHLKSQDSVCRNCFRKTHTVCEMDYINNLLEEEEINRRKHQFQPTDSITGFHESLMAEIINAVNNLSSIYRSYSKYLAAPLFKYMNFYTGGVLKYSYFLTNTAEADVVLSWFDWYPPLNADGEEKNQYYEEYFTIDFPLKELSHPECILEKIYENMEEQHECRDLDNIEITLTGVTVDISKIHRTAFDNYCNIHALNWIKRITSYKKDAEVLTTFSPNSYVIKNKRIIQLIRYIYLLKIGGAFSEQSQALVRDILSGKHADRILLEECEQEAFQVIWQYLQNNDTIEQEKKCYEEMFSPRHPYYFQSFRKQGILDYFEKILNYSSPSDYSNLFETNFLRWMITESHLIP